METMLARTHYSSDQLVAERGEHIYQERFKTEYENIYNGQHVAIDILTKRAYVAAFPHEALDKAKAAAPDGLFHVMKIESPAPFNLRIKSYPVDSLK
jgi:hypothetical protein